MRMTAKRLAVAGIAAAALTAPGLASAFFYGFNVIADGDSDPDRAQIGETQLFVGVTDYGQSQGNAQVLFTFYNVALLGTDPSSITDVYFEDGALMGLTSLIDADDGTGGDAGVDFSPGASPGDLPGGNFLDPSFVATQEFNADSDSGPGGVQPKGVNPGESLGVVIELQNGLDFDDVLDSLAAGVAKTAGISTVGTDLEGVAPLRIGIHVQGFADGGSESFINTGAIPDPFNQTLVPIPAAAWLFGSALLGMVGVGFRRQKNATAA